MRGSCDGVTTQHLDTDRSRMWRPALAGPGYVVSGFSPDLAVSPALAGPRIHIRSPDVLRPKANPDDSGGDALQNRPTLQQFQRPRRIDRRIAAKHVPDDPILDRHLHPLRCPSG